MRIDVLTLFPEAIEPFFDSSIIGRARQAGLVQIETTNFRDFAKDAHRSVDDKPFGGGPGMVLMCGPLFDAVESVEAGDTRTATRILLTPQGQPFTHAVAEELSRKDRLLLICGHYEGFDERIRTGLSPREISIGDYVLSGGESAAMVLIDAIVRLIPGALGDAQSIETESFAQSRLEYPQYTRPREYREMQVPDVLLSGNHQAIADWRAEQALARTKQRRPDLLNQKNEQQETIEPVADPKPTATKHR